MQQIKGKIAVGKWRHPSYLYERPKNKDIREGGLNLEFGRLLRL